VESLLDSLVFPQPFPSLITLFTVLGFLYWGKHLAKFYFKKKPNFVELASGYVLTVSIVGLASDLFLYGVLSKYILNIMAGVLVTSGLLQTLTLISSFKFAIGWLKSANRTQQIQLILFALILFLLFISALAPPTDADSLDYHLGAPAVWLHKGGYIPLESWYSSRLAGIGERIILFGLANGTDSLSAMLQWSGLLIGIVAIFELSETKSHNDLILSAALILSAPVIVFLVVNQKPYLFPAVSIALGVSLLVSESNAYEFKKKLSISTVLIVLAVSYKYSFLLSVMGTIPLLFYYSWKHSSIKFLFGIGLVTVLILLIPTYVRNLIYFGDPVSPLLSRYLIGIDPVLVFFSEFLRVGYFPSWQNIIRIPIEQGIFPLSLGRISTVIGVGGLGVLMALFSRKKGVRLIMISFSIMFALFVFLGRPISRARS